MIRKKATPSNQAGGYSSPVDVATLYSGGAEHAIDGSNRIMLPSEWRGQGTPTRFYVVVAARENYLLICPPPVFGRFLAELCAETADKTQIPNLERELNSRACQVSLDRFGRLPLPADYLARVGMQQHGKLVGRYSKFEIWQPEKYQAAQAERQQVVRPLLKKLEEL